MFGQSHLFQGSVNSLPQFRAAETVHGPQKAEILQTGEVRIDREVLRHDAQNSSAFRVTCIEHVAAEPDFPRVGVDQAGNDGHRRRFSGSVGPQQAEDLAVFNFKADIINNEPFVVALPEVIGIQRHFLR